MIYAFFLMIFTRKNFNSVQQFVWILAASDISDMFTQSIMPYAFHWKGVVDFCLEKGKGIII